MVSEDKLVIKTPYTCDIFEQYVSNASFVGSMCIDYYTAFLAGLDEFEKKYEHGNNYKDCSFTIQSFYEEMYDITTPLMKYYNPERHESFILSYPFFINIIKFTPRKMKIFLLVF